MVLMVIIMVVVYVDGGSIQLWYKNRLHSSLYVTLVPILKGWWFLIKKYYERVIESGNKYFCWWFPQNIFDDDFYIIYLMAMVPMQAMARGLGSRLQQPMFTTCGKIKVKVVKSKIDLKFAVKFEICGEIQDQFEICDPDQFKSSQLWWCTGAQV